MAKPSRFDNSTGTDFVTLNTYEAVTEKLQQIPDKLIIILFNIRYPDRFTLESRMKRWHKDFKKKYDVQFFKCIVGNDNQDLKQQFEIKRQPAVIFFRNGIEIEKIDDFEESDPNIQDTSRHGQESNDENRLQRKIIDLQPKK